MTKSMGMKTRFFIFQLSLLSVVACAGKSHRKHEVVESGIPTMDRDTAMEKIAAVSPSNFVWPLQENVLVNYYGWRHRRMHEGVDIRAFTGTPVFAAAEGEVIFSGRSKGYGKMIAVRHHGGWNTIYAHLSKLSARAGDRIKQGELIGASGNTGRSRGPHLHFELRKGSDPVDPVVYLPALQSRGLITRSF